MAEGSWAQYVLNPKTFDICTVVCSVQGSSTHFLVSILETGKKSETGNRNSRTYAKQSSGGGRKQVRRKEIRRFAAQLNFNYSFSLFSINKTESLWMASMHTADRFFLSLCNSMLFCYQLEWVGRTDHALIATDHRFIVTQRYHHVCNAIRKWVVKPTTVPTATDGSCFPLPSVVCW